MDLLPEPIRRFAEDPNAFLPDEAIPLRRVRTPSFVHTVWPTQSGVAEIRTTDDELDETIEQARRLVGENGHTRATWTVGPSCTPAGLATRLRERGFVPAIPPLEPSLTAMALVTPPPPPPGGVETRLVKDFDEYVTAFRIANAAFDVPEEVAAQQLAALPEMWKRYDGVNRFAHLAFRRRRADRQLLHLCRPDRPRAQRALGLARGSPPWRLPRSWRGAVSSRSACSTSSTTRHSRLPPNSWPSRLSPQP